MTSEVRIHTYKRLFNSCFGAGAATRFEKCYIATLGHRPVTIITFFGLCKNEPRLRIRNMISWKHRSFILCERGTTADHEPQFTAIFWRCTAQVIGLSFVIGPICCCSSANSLKSFLQGTLNCYYRAAWNATRS